MSASVRPDSTQPATIGSTSARETIRAVPAVAPP
jgi:hypothetical protein